MCHDLPTENEDATGVHQLDAGTPVALLAAAITVGALLIAAFAPSATAIAIAFPVATAAALVAGRAIRSEKTR